MYALPVFAYDRGERFHGHGMTEKFDFDEIIDRGGTGSTKWDKYPGRDILPMWVADSDFRLAPVIEQAIHARTEHGVFGYTHETPRLNDLIVARMRERYAWEIQPQWLVWLPGVVGAMHATVRSLGRIGDPVFTPSVIYPRFTELPSLCSRELQKIPMCLRERRMVLDLDWLEKNPGRPGQVLLLCNPQNPGGAIYREAEMRRLGEIAEAQNLVLVSDEIHCELLLDTDKRHIPLGSLGPDTEQRSVTLMAPTKTFNFPGLSCAFAIVPNRKLRAGIKRARRGIIPYISALGYAAAEAAYRDGDEWNRQQCAYLAANRDLLIEEINRIPGLKLGPVEATYLAWIDVSGLELDDPPSFFENAGVGLSPGHEFGDSGFMRLNFGCPRSRVELALERIRRAVDALG